MFRLIEISSVPSRLSLNGDCLEVTGVCNDQLLERLPLNELDAIILAQPAISISAAVIAACGKYRVVILCCIRASLPSAIVTPVFASRSHLNLLQKQISQSIPEKKRLWQALIQCKITGQDTILQHWRKTGCLRNLALKVRSGDTGNLESRAAVIYWKSLALFPSRKRDANDANVFFNYAYAILYAVTARYICAMGLEPHLGIQHSNPGNHFCLASDLMEPFRPAADECVLEVIKENQDILELNTKSRHSVCKRLYESTVIINGKPKKLLDAIRICVDSYRQAVLIPKKKLALPEWNKFNENQDSPIAED